MFDLWSAQQHNGNVMFVLVCFVTQGEGYRGQWAIVRTGPWLVSSGPGWPLIGWPMLLCDTKGRRNPRVFGDNNDFTSTRVACHICQELMRSEWAIMQLNTQRMSHGNDSLQTGRWGLGIKKCPRLLLAAHDYFQATYWLFLNRIILLIPDRDQDQGTRKEAVW